MLELERDAARAEGPLAGAYKSAVVEGWRAMRSNFKVLDTIQAKRDYSIGALDELRSRRHMIATGAPNRRKVWFDWRQKNMPVPV